jgi:hypothetical protein
MAREGLLAVERLRGQALSGRGQAGTLVLMLVAPPLWHGMSGYGHVEQPLEMWLTLLGARFIGVRRTGRAGVALGLAALSRSTALAYAAPLALAAVAVRRLRGAVVLVAGLGLTIAVLMVPLLLADGRDVVYSLVTYRGDLPVGGGSAWLLAVGTPAAGFAQHGDAQVIAGAVVLVSVAGLWRVHANLDRALFATLTAAAACFPMLAKTVWPYYMLDPFILAAVWWLGQRPVWRSWRVAAPLAVIAAEVLAELGTTLPPDGRARLLESVMQSALMLTVAGLVLAPQLAGSVIQGRAR